MIPAASTPHNSNNTAGDNSGVSSSDMTTDILYYINRHRTSIGLPALKILDIASTESYQHSANMAAHRTPFGHGGFEVRLSAISRSLGAPVSARLKMLAFGQLTAQQVVDGWLHSPGHKMI